MKLNNPIKIGTLLTIIFLAAGWRLVMPAFMGHPSNFSPIGAMALFSGAYFGRKWVAFIFPLMALWLSDIFVTYIHINEFMLFYPGFYWQYGSFILIILLGSSFIKKVKPLRILTCSLSSSLLFFIISNFGVWASGKMYSMTFSGLVSCYIAGIPFFDQTIISDLLFSTILFGAFELAKSKLSVLSKV